MTIATSPMFGLSAHRPDARRQFRGGVEAEGQHVALGGRHVDELLVTLLSELVSIDEGSSAASTIGTG